MEKWSEKEDNMDLKLRHMYSTGEWATRCVRGVLLMARDLHSGNSPPSFSWSHCDSRRAPVVPLVSGASGACWATQMPGGDGGHHHLDIFMQGHSFGNKERHVDAYLFTES